MCVRVVLESAPAGDEENFKCALTNLCLSTTRCVLLQAAGVLEQERERTKRNNKDE